jgi:hypothetical protein
MELLRKLVDHRPPAVGSLVELDPALGAIVDRMLETRPHQRARDARQIADELDGWLRARGHPPGELRADLAVFVRRHCADHQRRIETIVARGDRGEGETLITQRWSAGARPDETMARRALERAIAPEGDVATPPAGAASTRVAPVSVAPSAPPSFHDLPEEEEEVTAQAFAPVRAPLLSSRWGVVGVAAAGAGVGAVIVALLVASGREAPAAAGPPVQAQASEVSEEASDDGSDKASEIADTPEGTVASRELEAPIAEAPAEPDDSAEAAPIAPRPRLRRPTPPRSKLPCTPAHFDYPACLK